MSSWEEEGVRSATEYGPICMQNPYFAPDKIDGSENCLFLNIYTKDQTAKKPVLFFIHGGAFIYGNPKMTGEYLLEEDIVLVTVHYRLGPMGWLTTADSEAPGNYGLQDQILALRWVQQHIGAFGGDKDQVTVAGLSAGGASVTYLLLSPQTKGLFSRAFSMSGSALAWWANIPHQERTAARLARALDCPTRNSAEMLSCLRAQSASEIMVAQASLYAWHPSRMEKEPMNIWSPRPDPEAGEAAVLPLEPRAAMSGGQVQPVPFLVGVTENEGIWQAANYLEQSEVMDEFLQKFDDVGRHSLGLVNQVKSEDMGMIMGRIKDFYLSDLVTMETHPGKRLESVASGMVDMMGDAMFNYPIDRMVRLLGSKENSPVWMYQYNYKHNFSLAFFDPANPGQVRRPSHETLHGATHGHDTFMLFPFGSGVMTEEETKHSRNFVKFVVDFMVNGHPKSGGTNDYNGWEPVTDGQLTYYVHDKHSGPQQGLPHQNRMQWWSELPVFWNKNPEDLGRDDDSARYYFGEIIPEAIERKEEL